MSLATSFSAGVLVPSASGTVTTLTACNPENEIDDPPSCAAGRVNTGAPESSVAVAGPGVAPGACAESPAGVCGPPGGSDRWSVGASDDGAVGVGCGVLQSIRIGMHNAERAESADAGGGAAPRQLTATSRHSATAMRDRFTFCVQCAKADALRPCRCRLAESRQRSRCRLWHPTASR